MRRLALLFVVVAGCAHEGSNEAAPAQPTQPGVAFAQPPPPSTPATTTTPTAPPSKATTRIELTAVTLADDCGGAPPWGPPVRTAATTKDATHVAKAERKADEDYEPSPKAAKSKAKGDSAHPSSGARAKRRCEQTSMQLAIMAGDASKIQVKSVELFDETGKSLGMLTPSKPTRWSDASGQYETWDESVTAGSSSSISYVLSQPKWDHIGDRWNKTYTLKTVVSVGGVDQAAQKDVTLSAPTSLPPNVKT